MLNPMGRLMNAGLKMLDLRTYPLAGLGIAAHDWQVCDGALRADIIGNLVDFSGERFCAGQAEDVIDAVVLARRLWPGIVPVATQCDASLVRRLAPTSTPLGVLPGRGTTGPRPFSVS